MSNIESISLEREINGSLFLGYIIDVNSINDKSDELGESYENTLLTFSVPNNNDKYMFFVEDLNVAETIMNAALSAFKNVCKRENKNFRQELMNRFPVYEQAFSK